MDQYTAFIQSIAQKLVEKPDQVRVQAQQEESNIALRLHVAQDDLGKVIGKEGKTARAMRILLGVMASKDHKSISLEIVE